MACTLPSRNMEAGTGVTGKSVRLFFITHKSSLSQGLRHAQADQQHEG